MVNKRDLIKTSLTWRVMRLLWLVIGLNLLAFGTTLPQPAWADGGGPLPTLTPTQTATQTPTIIPTATGEPTLTETPVPTTEALLPIIQDNNEVAQVSPTPLPAQKQSLPSLLCFSAFAVVFFVIVVIVSLWVLGHRNPPGSAAAP